MLAASCHGRSESLDMAVDMMLVAGTELPVLLLNRGVREGQTPHKGRKGLLQRYAVIEQRAEGTSRKDE